MRSKILSLKKKFMNWLKNLLRSKKFWTMVASIVAALAAFFATSCTSMLELRREGLHHDTIEYRLMTRSKKLQTFLSLCSAPISLLNISKPLLSEIGSRSSLNTVKNVASVMDGAFFGSLFRCRNWSSDLSIVSPIEVSRLASGRICLIVPFSSRSISSMPSLLSALLLPAVVFSEARGGRGRRRGKGRPRPGIISIPLGGKHL